jgi:hypothetical protein
MTVLPSVFTSPSLTNGARLVQEGSALLLLSGFYGRS